MNLNEEYLIYRKINSSNSTHKEIFYSEGVLTSKESIEVPYTCSKGYLQSTVYRFRLKNGIKLITTNNDCNYIIKNKHINKNNIVMNPAIAFVKENTVIAYGLPLSDGTLLVNYPAKEAKVHPDIDTAINDLNSNFKPEVKNNINLDDDNYKTSCKSCNKEITVKNKTVYCHRCYKPFCDSCIRKHDLSCIHKL